MSSKGFNLTSFSVADVITCTSGRLVNSEHLGSRIDAIRVFRPSSLGGSKATDLAFFFSRAFEHELPSARPGILVIGESYVLPLEKAGLPFWESAAIVACTDPYLALALLSEMFAKESSPMAHITPRNKDVLEVHPTAWVSPSAILGPGVSIGPHCVVEAKAQIGARSVLYPACYIGEAAVLGEDCVLFPRVTLYEWTQIGNRVRIHAGSVLGADGFGYAPRREGKQVRGHQKIYHLGRVLMGDDVELGAQCAVDRGTLGETRVANQVKLDNFVHLGHNVRVDEGAVICAGTCLAGHASVGKFAYVGGLVGITNHVHVGDRANVCAMTLVTKDVSPGETVGGNPQRTHTEHFRAHALLNKLLMNRRPK